MESESMPRARALVAAVPQRVWTAVAGLVLLASLGVTLVLAAGLSTWQGAVSNGPAQRSAPPPGSVVTPPGSAVVVVPTPHARPAATAPPHPRPATVTVALPPAAAPVAAPTVAAPQVPKPVAPTPVTASPRVVRGHVEDGGGRHAKKAKHADRGRHLGWFKNSHGHHG